MTYSGMVKDPTHILMGKGGLFIYTAGKVWVITHIPKNGEGLSSFVHAFHIRHGSPLTASGLGVDHFLYKTL